MPTTTSQNGQHLRRHSNNRTISSRDPWHASSFPSERSPVSRSAGGKFTIVLSRSTGVFAYRYLNLVSSIPPSTHYRRVGSPGLTRVSSESHLEPSSNIRPSTRAVLHIDLGLASSEILYPQYCSGRAFLRSAAPKLFHNQHNTQHRPASVANRYPPTTEPATRSDTPEQHYGIQLERSAPFISHRSEACAPGAPCPRIARKIAAASMPHQSQSTHPPKASSSAGHAK